MASLSDEQAKAVDKIIIGRIQTAVIPMIAEAIRRVVAQEVTPAVENLKRAAAAADAFIEAGRKKEAADDGFRSDVASLKGRVARLEGSLQAFLDSSAGPGPDDDPEVPSRAN
jgi:hypothetical protein